MIIPRAVNPADVIPAEAGTQEAGTAGFYPCSMKRCASSAAMQPVPALVMAWR